MHVVPFQTFQTKADAYSILARARSSPAVNGVSRRQLRRSIDWRTDETRTRDWPLVRRLIGKLWDKEREREEDGGGRRAGN